MHRETIMSPFEMHFEYLIGFHVLPFSLMEQHCIVYSLLNSPPITLWTSLMLRLSSIFTEKSPKFFLKCRRLSTLLVVLMWWPNYFPEVFLLLLVHQSSVKPNHHMMLWLHYQYFNGGLSSQWKGSMISSNYLLIYFPVFLCRLFCQKIFLRLVVTLRPFSSFPGFFFMFAKRSRLYGYFLCAIYC